MMRASSDDARPVRVLIVAADALTRAGLAALLADSSDVDVVGQVEESDDLEAMLDVFRPEVLVWEVSWENPGRSVERMIAVADDAPPMLALRARPDYDDALWGAGVRGVIGRNASATQLRSALHAVSSGLVVAVPGDLPRRSTYRSLPSRGGEEVVESLTAREAEVLQLLAEGLANKEIARTLALSENTVKFHVNAILGKLGASSRTDAVVRATRAGILLL